MKRIIWIGSLSVVTLVLMGLLLFFGPYAARAIHFQADVENGYHADFYLYVSPGARRAARNGQTVNLLVQPNNLGRTSNDPAVYQRDAWWTGFERREAANRLDAVLLVPAFLRPADDWHIYTHALDRDSLLTERKDVARLDLQLIAMVSSARDSLAQQGIILEEKFFIQGFSASGMFANRFTILHPELVKAAVVGSPGGWPIAPITELEGNLLPYPIGVGDLETLLGRPFDLEAYQQVPQLFIMGDKDENDSLDFTDGWDPEMAEFVDRHFGRTPVERWGDATQLYETAETDAQFMLVANVGHDRVALQNASTSYFLWVLSNERQIHN